ncbi:hypothetical protein GW916_15690 [bacterium]|nr:hypothetical protein [bacterium]
MSNRLQFEPLVNFDASTLNGTYQVINGTGTENALNIFKFYNSSTSLVLLSFNGTDDHDFVPPGGTYILDVETNADQIGGLDGTKKLPEGQLVYAKTSSNTDRLIFAGYY